MSAGSVLFIDEVHLTLGLSLVLLHLDHGLDLLGALPLVVLVLLPHFADHLFFTLSLHGVLLGLQVGHLLVLVDFMIVFLFDVEIHLGLLTLLLHLLLLSHKLLLLKFHVSSALAYNISGALTSLIDLFDCLSNTRDVKGSSL